MVIIAANELSFDVREKGKSDSTLAKVLVETIEQVEKCFPIYNIKSIELLFHDTPTLVKFPNQTKVSRVIDILRANKDFTYAQKLTEIINRSRKFSSLKDTSISIKDLQGGRGISEAYLTDSMLFSLNVICWQKPVLEIQKSGKNPKNIINLFHPKLQTDQILILKKKYIKLVLPNYEDDGRHDPSSNKYINGKSHIPKKAFEILRKAKPENETTWWAKCEHGFFHRFQGSTVKSIASVHWNGTTNPNASQTIVESTVPAELKTLLRDLVCYDCECREL